MALLKGMDSNTPINTKYVKVADINLTLKKFITGLSPKILNRVKELISINHSVPKTLAFIKEMSDDVEQSIQTKNHLLQKLEEKLNTAKNLKDRELELKILDFIQLHKDSLKEYTACKESLKATYQLVENDHFFSRFNEILEYQLGTDEKRLIILYFVDCLILSTDQEPQLHYKSNIFSNLIPPLDEVPKHQRKFLDEVPNIKIFSCTLNLDYKQNPYN